MCGRYKLSAKSGALCEFFDIHGDQLKLELTPHWNIAPTQPIAIIRTSHQRRCRGREPSTSQSATPWAFATARERVQGRILRLRGLPDRRSRRRR